MALKWADRVLETSTTTGTGPIALAAAVVGYQRFSAACSVSDTCYYGIVAVDASGIPTGEWESGLGTYSGTNTLTRTSVSASSNANAAVNFSAGVKQVFLTRIATTEPTAFILTLLNDADAPTARTTLGVYSTSEVDSLVGAIDPGDGLVDAPSDGTLYGRLDGAWAEVDASTEGLLDLKGGFDASLDPAYPAGEKGDTYIISVAGTIGGNPAEQNDLLICILDTAGGDGAFWLIVKNGGGDLLAANNLDDLDSASTARTNLGLAIGTDVQAYSANLDAITALTDPGIDSLIYWDDSDGDFAYAPVGAAATKNFSNSTTLSLPSPSSDAAISEAAVATHLSTFYMPLAGGVFSGAVQTTTLEIGHATDTTLARSGAGDLTIEGNAIYRAGGTDVPIADGGTGASTVAGAQTNLKFIVLANQAAYDALSPPDSDAFYFVPE